MFDFANLLAEYAGRVAIWPGLGMSLPIVLLLLAVRRLGRTSVRRYEDERHLPATFYLLPTAFALLLLASLPIATPSITLPTFGTLPSGQALPDSLFSLLLLPIASAGLFTTRGRAARWLVAALPAMVGLLVVLGSGQADGWGGAERGLTLLACLPLLLVSDALLGGGSWQIRLAGEFGWLAMVALLVIAITPSLPHDPLTAGIVLALAAILSGIVARLLNRRWPQLAQRLLPLSTGAAILATFIALIT